MAKKGCIGFISTRFSGTDGVSLETAKWVSVLDRLGFDYAFFAGESDWPEDRSYVLPEAHFEHPDIRALTVDLFDDYIREPETTRQVDKLQQHIKGHLHKFLDRFDPDLLIVENALSLPMNVPLGMAITKLVAEAHIPVIAHHHDFTWERSRYSISAAEDYLRAAFPPVLHDIRHVVINSFAERQLALRTGVSSTLIPNVMDFDTPPEPPNDYTADFRRELGIGPDDYILLQPTRIVPRKRIELAIEITRRLELPSVLLITHHGGDELTPYESFLHDYAELMNVRVLFAAERFEPFRRTTADGTKIFSLADGYQQASMVTYPSRVEGFGNAFLETIYYKKPIIMSTYEIFKTDIQPKGFDLITFDDFVDTGCIRETREILLNPAAADEMVAHNYDVASHYYSFRVLERRLKNLLNESLGLE